MEIPGDMQMYNNIEFCFALTYKNENYYNNSCFFFGTDNSLSSSLMLKLDACRNTSLCSPFPEAFWNIKYYLI